MEKIMSPKIVGLFIAMMVSYATSDDARCDRTPLGIKVAPLRPTNQFVLEVDNIIENKYIPNTKYTVTLRSTDKKSKFIAFTISLKEDSNFNKINPRKPIALNAGYLYPFSNSTLAITSPNCVNTIMQTDVTPKNKVQVQWQAPGKDNKCVSIFAVVAVDPKVWYNFDPPLSLKVCEDPRKADDMPPTEVDGDCQTCEDARYELTFQGLWVFNTHHDMFPKTIGLARFSDLVGASHSPDTTIFDLASPASPGIKMLAEQGNTTQFEVENQQKLPTKVRTVIKATRPKNTSSATVTSFRATSRHHRLSMAVGILPSPDWFLGVTQLELCMDAKKWRDKVTLNLYPLDAGTDKGTDFESSNEEQSPPQAIATLKSIGKDQIVPSKPFAKIIVRLVRTYTTPQCLNTFSKIEDVTEGVIEDTGDNGDEDDKEDQSEYQTQRPSFVTQRTTTTSEGPEPVDPVDPEDLCPMTAWGNWTQCEGLCENGILTGGQMRFRYHIVDGIILKSEKYKRRVPKLCLNTDNYPDTDFQPCQDSCNENGDGEEEENVEGTQEDEPGEASRITWQYYKSRK